MADDTDNLLVDEDEEEDKPEEEKKGLSESIVKYLIYLGLVLGVILISVVSSIIVNKYYGQAKPVVSDYRTAKTDTLPPKAVYEIPEFKLALDKKDDESMTTIVQVKLSLAYAKDNNEQATLNEIIARKEEIRDKIQYVIAKKKYEDIKIARKRDEDLKDDLKYEINKILNKEVLDVYFHTFVISRTQG